MNKLTDNEIIKALECCIDCKCKECPCYKNIEGEMYCTEIDEEEILDLINRQQAEIEKLNKARQKQAVFLGEEREQKYELIDKLSKANTEIERLRAEADMAEGYADALVARAKSEAIKEFAERLKIEAFECDVSFGYGKECYQQAVAVIEIDNLAKEMTEQSNFTKIEHNSLCETETYKGGV